MKKQKTIQVRRLFNKNGKVIPNLIMCEGIVYKKIKSDNAEDIKTPDCDNCDFSLMETWCKLGITSCKAKPKECYKVMDDSKKIKIGYTYNIPLGAHVFTCLATKGKCYNCEFFEPISKDLNCKLTKFVCLGNHPLKRIKGGI